VLLLVGVGVFGGLGYAKSAANRVGKVADVVKVSGTAQSAHATARAAAATKSTRHDDDDDDADEDQYKPGKGCGDKNHVHRRNDECHDHGGHGH
jgi:hypothetical protein